MELKKLRIIQLFVLLLLVLLMPGDDTNYGQMLWLKNHVK